MEKQLSLSVFFPCFNDESTIGGLVERVDRLLSSFTSDYEITVINDGSTDRSYEVLEGLMVRFKKLRVINHGTNRGYGAAIRTGFRSAKKELVFYTDGDGQYDVAELLLLLGCLTADVDIVNGIKMGRRDESIRIFLGHVYKSVMRNLFNLPVYDPDCDFRLIRKRVLQKIRLESNSGAICLELVKKLQLAGARFREVSVHHYPRVAGKSQFFKVKPLFLTVMDIMVLWARLYIFRE